MNRRTIHCRFFALLLVSLSLAQAAAYAGPAAADECDAYLNKARELSCTERNYLVNFGYRYCRAFIDHNERFSEAGQVATARIRSCLIRVLETNDDLKCRNVRAISVKAHVGCYVDSGFCEMNFLDRWVILELIWPELFNTRMFNSALEILDICMGLPRQT